MKPVLASLCIAVLAASEPMGSTPLLIQGGVSYPVKEMRDELGNEWGAYGGLGVLLSEKAIIGVPSSDIDLRWHRTGEGRMSVLSACYTERAIVSDSLWVGVGVGANYSSIHLNPSAERPEAVDEKKWGIGGKATLGIQFSNRFFVEGAFHYTGDVGGINTNGATLGLGWWL